MTDLLEAAAAYARRGWRVFPVHSIIDGRCSCRRECSSPGKHPLVRRGLHEATTDRRAIGEWWTLWPFANIATATGVPSALAVIDVDGPGGEASLVRLDHLGFQLSSTLTAITGNGRHLYFTCERELPNATRHLPGIEGELPGIDLRADGGYVVIPPSTHANGRIYRWVDPEASLAPLPAWIRAPDRPNIAVPSQPSSTFTGDGTPYGLAALRDEIDVLARTPKGSRNDQLNRAAFALGQLVAGGELAEALARSSLEGTAALVGLTPQETRSTIQSGLSAGMDEPRSASTSHTAVAGAAPSLQTR